MTTTTELSICESQNLIYQEIPQYNIIFVNFASLIPNIYKLYFSLLETYNISESNSHDSTKLLYHCVIIELCNFLKDSKINKQVVIFAQYDQDNLKLKAIDSLLKKLPCGFIASKLSFQKFIESIVKKDHIIMESIDDCLKYRDTQQKKRYREFQKFLKKHGLSYIYSTYLKQQSNKITLLR